MDAALKHLAEGIPTAMGKIDLTGLMGSIKSFGSDIAEAFAGKDLDADKLAASIQAVIDTISTLIDVTHGIAEGLAPFAAGIMTIIKGINDLAPEAKQQLGDLLGVANRI